MGVAEFIAGLLTPGNGVIFLLGVATFYLVRDHARRDAKIETLLDVATAGWKTQTDANADLGEALKRKAK